MQREKRDRITEHIGMEVWRGCRGMMIWLVHSRGIRMSRAPTPLRCSCLATQGKSARSHSEHGGEAVPPAAFYEWNSEREAVRLTASSKPPFSTPHPPSHLPSASRHTHLLSDVTSPVENITQHSLSLTHLLKTTTNVYYYYYYYFHCYKYYNAKQNTKKHDIS